MFKDLKKAIFLVHHCTLNPVARGDYALKGNSMQRAGGWEGDGGREYCAQIW